LKKKFRWRNNTRPFGKTYRRTGQSLRAAAIYDIFAQVCLHDFIKDCHRGTADPKTLTTKLPEGELDFDKFCAELGKLGSRALVETKRNANRAVTRNYLKEVFRVTQSYCDKSGQYSVLESESWYHFTRILVNSLSHNFRLEFRDNDKKYLPVSYGDETLDLKMDGQAISGKLELLVRLADEIINFSRDRLAQ